MILYNHDRYLFPAPKPEIKTLRGVVDGGPTWSTSVLKRLNGSPQNKWPPLTVIIIYIIDCFD